MTSHLPLSKSVHLNFSEEFACHNVDYLMSSYEFRVPEAHRFMPSILDPNFRIVLIHVSVLYFKEAFFQKMNLDRIKLLMNRILSTF